MAIGLTLGALNESVTVSAETPALQTDRTDTGRIIESTQLVQLPPEFNRNFQGMLITVPGASRPFRPHSEFFNSQDSLSSNVNGQSRLANNVQLEGTDNNHKAGLLTVLIPSAEALETVAVTTSNYDAEFGRAGGAVTNVTLKSGTNDLSGTLFTFGNTEATVARNPFSALPDVPPTTYLQTGFTIGGPIIRNKLFFLVTTCGPSTTAGESRARICQRLASGTVTSRCADRHLRSVDRQSGRHGPDSVSEQPDPR